jgi:protein-S-isoprenylcysteine O-methyltransferase Ste14
MNEVAFHTTLCWAVIGVGLLTFIVLCFVAAPYGRHYLGHGWGPKISSRLGWFIMEAPSVFVFLWIFSYGRYSDQWVPLLLLGVWQLHYLHRALVFPLRMKTTGKHVPTLVVGLGFGFNTVNSYLNARWISNLGHYPLEWLTHPALGLGIFVFLIGFLLNIHSDSILFRLRCRGETGYQIPNGGAYRWISSPNYLGELLEWAGWALATWSLSGLAFFFYSAANLVPRAASHHRWYRQTFANYPHNRKRLVPHVY